MPSLINATTTNGLVTSADNSGSLQLQTNNGTTAVTIDTSQNVGIGTTSPTAKLEPFYTSTAPSLTSSSGAGLSVRGSSTVRLNVGSYPTSSFAAWIQASDNANSSYDIVVNPLGGNVAFGQTSGTNPSNGAAFVRIDSRGTYWINATTENAAWDHYVFRNGNGSVGSIRTSGTSTSYLTSSDYRLKENTAPMTGALAKVALLKPVTYTWKTDGSAGQGFIAHELQAVVPDCVSGDKDAVELVDVKDEEGNVIGQEERPVYQGVDTSFLVATLTAAIQEQQAQIEELKAEVQALKEGKQ